MKWVAFIIILAGIRPLSVWLRSNYDKSPLVWILVGFLPFILTNFHLYFAIDSWVGWIGYVTGAEFSVLDALAIALYLSLPRVRQPLPFRISMMLYFLAVFISAFQAQSAIAALFYPWQLARMFLLYAVVSKAVSADPRVAPALLAGMAAALTIQAGVAFWQRFGLGILQVTGTVGHQNTLGLMSHFIVIPCFALLLAGQRRWWMVSAVLAGVVIEVLTASRATLWLACVGFATVFVLSALRQWTSRKTIVLFLGLMAIVVLLPFALSAITQRGETQMQESGSERLALEAASAAMLSDHPWGVGSNNYVVVANVGGYYQKAGVAWTSYTAEVHNVFWLVAAETGYFGLITFVLFLVRPLMVALLCGWRFRGDVRGDLLIGLGVALLIVYIHSGFEWIFLLFEPQYIFAIDLGLVAGLAAQLGYWRRHNLQRVRLGVGIPSIAASNRHGGVNHSTHP